MTAADKAFAEAQRLIADAARTGATALDFDSRETRALTKLPEEISTLTALTRLYLGNTQVADVTPLSPLTALTYLDLGNTQVADVIPLSPLTALTTLDLGRSQVADVTPLSTLTALTYLDLSNTPTLDLRSLRSLSQLLDNPEFDGLRFTNTAATRANPRIAEIAEIEDPATRARTLFEYLEHWEPPGEAPTPSKPETLFETILTDGQLEIAADPPSQNERDEALKQALHQRLQLSAPDLARAAGNIFPRLASKARVLERLVSQAFADLDLLSIHLEVEILQDRLTRGSEDGVAFSDDVLGPLSDITRAGPGLTLGHPSVDLFVIRVREARENPLPAEDEAKHRALSQQVQQDAEANGPKSRAMEDRIFALEDSAQRQAGWRAKHKWILWTVAAVGVAGNFGLNLAAGLVQQNFGVPLSDFIASNAALLWDVALTYGAGFATWFAAIMGPIYLSLGVKQSIVDRMTKSKP